MEKTRITAAWILLLIVVSLCYWPGLYGGFVFDDDINIIQNRSLQIKHAGLDELWAAAFSGHAGPLGRPIALLSFALNYYFAGGFESFHYKITNLAIHLCNMLLVGYLTRNIFRALIFQDKYTIQSVPWWPGLVVAALWGLHPLNLTAVLYVVQRMTSLSTFFGLAALAVFCWYRSATSVDFTAKAPFGMGIFCGVFVFLSLFLSLLSKESGILFFLLLIWLELVVFKFYYRGIALGVMWRWPLKKIVICGLVLCAIGIIFFKIPSMVSPAAYANRDFTLSERVLTEARILVFYLRLFFLPVSSQMSLYHDDFEVSHSLLSPISTLVSFAVLLAISVAAWFFRKRFPVLLLGWGWFLISHSLESTIFPLELVYEHRNYFAIVGIVFLVPATLLRIDMHQYGRIVWVLLVALCGLNGFITYNRSLQWSSNIDWAMLEAFNRPKSMRANYDLGRTYMVLLESTGNAKFGTMAEDAFIKSAENDPAAVLPLVARVQLAYVLQKNPPQELVAQVKLVFGSEKYRNVNTSALSSLVSCQLNKVCSLSDEDMLEVLRSAFENPYTPAGERAEILKLSAQYFINKVNDLQKGIYLIYEALTIYDSAASRIMYAQALAMAGEGDKALLELDIAQKIDYRREFFSMISVEREKIRKAFGKP